jgi:hypothetical protein
VSRRGRWNFPGCKGHPDNPKLSIYRPAEADDDIEDSKWIEVFESEVHPQVKKEIEFKFKKISLKLTRICNNKKTLPLKFKIESFCGYDKEEI